MLKFKENFNIVPINVVLDKYIPINIKFDVYDNSIESTKYWKKGILKTL